MDDCYSFFRPKSISVRDSDLESLSKTEPWAQSTGAENTQTTFLQRDKTPAPTKFPGYDTEQSDSEAPVNAGA